MRVLITGIGGQDGSYLAEALAARGDEVHGLVRPSTSPPGERVQALLAAPTPPRLHAADITDEGTLRDLVATVRPDVVYHLAAQSHVAASFALPVYTGDATGLGTARLLEALRREVPVARFYQASSSEMFGAEPPPQSERTAFHPRSPYAAAKVYAYHLTRNYREAYGMFACSGVLFNHEGPRRGESFVTRKITRAVGRIRHGLQRRLALGNLEARRDWGHARDYVEAMRLIALAEVPDDFVVGTGETHSVREFATLAFAHAGLDWRDFVDEDPALRRPAEVDALRADPSKIARVLGWEPRVSFAALVREMVDHDLALAAIEAGQGSAAGAQCDATNANSAS